jgi:hypothetical protein
VAVSDPGGPVGRWSHGGRLIEVVQHGDEYVMELSGVPAPYAPRLRRSAGEPDGLLVIVGGPYDGLSVTTVHRDGVDHLLVGGVLTLPRWRESADAPPGAGLIRGLPVWPDPPDAGTVRRYETLLAGVRGSGGSVVRPPADVALDSWVRWLSDQNAVLFHGSDNGGLDVLYPRRTSYEVDDQAQRGNRAAVYATDDGWWAMWFSVIDRGRVRGSIRSGVEVFVGPDGERLPVYRFSVDYRILPPPLRDGWLYVLARDTFHQLPVVPGGPPSHEWCSPQAVVPLARLPVRPSDFPFHDRISGHDDGDLFRLGELNALVRERITGGHRTQNGVALRVRWDAALASASAEYLELAHRFMPEIIRSFNHHHDDGVVWLHVNADGPLTDMLQNQFADLLD